MSPQDFRVLVYGQEIVGSCCTSSVYDSSEGRPSSLRGSIDKFVWGTVATEIRPIGLSCNEKRRRQRVLLFSILHRIASLVSARRVRPSFRGSLLCIPFH